jgi:hypothetical protein
MLGKELFIFEEFGIHVVSHNIPQQEACHIKCCSYIISLNSIQSISISTSDMNQDDHPQ